MRLDELWAGHLHRFYVFPIKKWPISTKVKVYTAGVDHWPECHAQLTTASLPCREFLSTLFSLRITRTLWYMEGMSPTLLQVMIALCQGKCNVQLYQYQSP